MVANLCVICHLAPTRVDYAVEVAHLRSLAGVRERAMLLRDCPREEEAAMRSRLSAAGLRDLEVLAKVLVETCVRNSELENLHAGTFPSSQAGDFSDVKVVTPYGEIPWARLSRISVAEMKVLMIDVVDRVFTYFRYPEEFGRIGGAARWDRPKLHPDLMRAIRRRRARARRDD